MSDSNVLPERSGRPRMLALDLEGTLISNAVSQIPRPGLHQFLESCRELFERVVMFTTVPEHRFREIARLLVSEGHAPDWFLDIDYVHWHGPTKDLSFTGLPWQDVLLVDDYESYVHPGQLSSWVPVRQFGHPYPENDEGLAEVFRAIRRRLGE